METYIILVTLILAFGGFTQGLTGFGLALVSVPLLSLVIGAKLAIPLVGIFGWIVNWPLVWKMRHSIQYKTGFILVASAIPATFLGGKLVANLPSHYLAISVGAILVVASLHALLFRITLATKTRSWITVCAGFSSGVLGSLGGPPVIAYTSFQPWTSDEVKSTLAFFFSLQMVATNLSFYNEGLFTTQVLSLAYWSMPIFVIGLTGGMLTYSLLQKYKINYQRIVQFLLLLIGGMLILNNLNIS